jgi:hypothetical protein
VVPNSAAHIRTLDDERLEAFVKDWISRRTRDYVETERWSGSGDRGRDVVGYERNHKLDVFKLLWRTTAFKAVVHIIHTPSTSRTVLRRIFFALEGMP